MKLGFKVNPILRCFVPGHSRSKQTMHPQILNYSWHSTKYIFGPSCKRDIPSSSVTVLKW